jgi:hypothetical protein
MAMNLRISWSQEIAWQITHDAGSDKRMLMERSPFIEAGSLMTQERKVKFVGKQFLSL